MKTTFILSFALFLTVVAVESRNLKSSTWQLRPVDLNNEKNLKVVTSRVEKVLPEVGNKSDPKSLGWNYKLDKVLEAYDLEIHLNGATQHKAIVLATAQEGPQKGQQRRINLDYSVIVYPGSPVKLRSWSFLDDNDQEVKSK